MRLLMSQDRTSHRPDSYDTILPHPKRTKRTRLPSEPYTLHPDSISRVITSHLSGNAGPAPALHKLAVDESLDVFVRHRLDALSKLYVKVIELFLFKYDLLYTNACLVRYVSAVSRHAPCTARQIHALVSCSGNLQLLCVDLLPYSFQLVIGQACPFFPFPVTSPAQGCHRCCR